MTTKKFSKEVNAKLKTLENITIEEMFDDYVLYQNSKRIGALFNNKVLLIGTENLHKTYPNLKQETHFNWGYYKLFYIDLDNLQDSTSIVYKDLYFNNEYVCNIADIILSYSRYSSIMVKIYDVFVTLLAFSWEKELLKQKPLDKNNRILKMNYINNDLTEKGKQIFSDLIDKWLTYNDKNDDNTEKRKNNIKMLEKYYNQLIKE